MNRYTITHPKTPTVTVPTLQRTGDFLFAFRNSPDFEQYRVTDSRTGRVFAPKNCDGLNGIEFSEVKP